MRTKKGACAYLERGGVGVEVEGKERFSGNRKWLDAQEAGVFGTIITDFLSLCCCGYYGKTIMPIVS